MESKKSKFNIGDHVNIRPFLILSLISKKNLNDYIINRANVSNIISIYNSINYIITKINGNVLTLIEDRVLTHCDLTLELFDDEVVLSSEWLISLGFERNSKLFIELTK